MTGKRNFSNYRDAEQYLFKLSNELLAGKITPSQAQAAAKLVDSWGRAHKLKESADIIRRLDGVEALTKKQMERKHDQSG